MIQYRKILNLLLDFFSVKNSPSNIVCKLCHSLPFLALILVYARNAKSTSSWHLSTPVSSWISPLLLLPLSLFSLGWVNELCPFQSALPCRQAYRSIGRLPSLQLLPRLVSINRHPSGDISTFPSISESVSLVWSQWVRLRTSTPLTSHPFSSLAIGRDISLLSRYLASC